MSAPGVLAVDIVVNNYNYGRYVAASIESALAQTHRPVQVIVVDDGSTDESREIIASYGSRVVPVLKENGGQASAVNAGWACSQADVLIFLDADDLLFPDAAGAAAAAFSAQPELARVQWRMEVVDGEGRRTGAVNPSLDVAMANGRLAREELVFPFDLPWVATSGTAFPRWALERVMPVPADDYRLGVDWYLSHVTTLVGPVRSFESPLGAYRVHDANRYGSSGHLVDLDRVRQSVQFGAATRRHLLETAQKLHQSGGGDDILSVSDLGNRLISLKLDPAAHPIPTDTLPRLAVGGLRAARRRWDVRWPVKVLFGLWFLVTALVPPAVARRLATAFLFRDVRPGLNRLLARVR